LNQKIQSGVPGPTQAILFSYNCTQDSKVKKKSIKSNDVMKHQDQPSMPTFSCGSLLKIRLQVISGFLTAQIILQHEDNHVPYCNIRIPEEAQQIIDAGVNSSFKDVSSV